MKFTENKKLGLIMQKQSPEYMFTVKFQKKKQL